MDTQLAVWDDVALPKFDPADDCKYPTGGAKALRDLVSTLSKHPASLPLKTLLNAIRTRDNYAEILSQAGINLTPTKPVDVACDASPTNGLVQPSNPDPPPQTYSSINKLRSHQEDVMTGPHLQFRLSDADAETLTAAWYGKPYPEGVRQSPLVEAASTLIHDLWNLDHDITNSPYNATLWATRAQKFYDFGHAELGASDAYKALMLACDKTRNPDQTDEDRIKTSKQALQLIVSALELMGCTEDLPAVIRRAGLTIPEELNIDQYLVQQTKNTSNHPSGGYPHRPYFWTYIDHPHRDQKAKTYVNCKFKPRTRDRKGPCAVRQSTLSDKEDFLGTFTNRAFAQGEVVFHSDEIIVASSSAADEFPWLTESTSGQDANVLLRLVMFQILKDCVAQKLHSPLSHPLISSLSAETGGVCLVEFSLERCVIWPNRALEDLGIDIFTHEGYDAWALNTTWMRIVKYCYGGGKPGNFYRMVAPAFTMLNHSCEPNVDWLVTYGEPDESGHDVIESLCVEARRPLRRGEELFISYIPEDVLQSPKRERRAYLRSERFTAGCLCSKCKGERAEERLRAEERKRALRTIREEDGEMLEDGFTEDEGMTEDRTEDGSLEKDLEDDEEQEIPHHGGAGPVVGPPGKKMDDGADNVVLHTDDDEAGARRTDAGADWMDIT